MANFFRCVSKLVTLNAALFFLSTGGLKASDLINVSPVTNRILCVYFDDGHIDYGPADNAINGNILYRHLLDTAAAELSENYSITSPNDINFQLAKSPVAVGRKSKGAEFHTPFSPTKFVFTHWVYIELPFALERGLTYTVELSGALAASVNNSKAYTFVFNEYNLVSPVVHVNQVGYRSDAPVKYAYLSQWMGDFNHGVHTAGGLNLDNYAGAKFHLVSTTDNSTFYSGTIMKRTSKTVIESDPLGMWFLDEFAPERNYSHADVWECDFSGFDISGEYILVVEGIGSSLPFEISSDPYREAFYTCMKGLFFQRTGIHKFVEEGVEYPRDHHSDDIDFIYDPEYKYWISGTHGAGNLSTGKIINNLWGHYQDAGDWDGYLSHTRVPLTLLMMYDMAPEKFADGDIGNKYKLSSSDINWIDEGTNGLPDILDEAAWLMDYYRRGRDAIQAQGWGTGGVPGEYTGREAGADKAPWQDTREWMVSAESPAATYYLAGMLAWYASCLDKHNGGTTHPLSAGLVAEAIDAYNWSVAYCQNNPSEDNTTVKTAKHVAAAALYRYSGSSVYLDDVKSNITAEDAYVKNYPDWSNPNYYYFTSYIIGSLPDSHPGLDITFQQSLKDKIASIATSSIINTAAVRGFRLGWEMHRDFALGTFSTPRTIPAVLAAILKDQSAYMKPVYSLADYMLGGNELNMVQITGLGENPNRYCHQAASWTLFDFNSKVYENETLPGYVTYFGDDDSWVGGPGDEREMRKSAYPAIKYWPEAESRFDSRQSINGSEYTIHQSHIQSIFTYGMLCTNSTGAYTNNARPVVTFEAPTEGSTFSIGSDISCRVSVSPDTRRVEYYADEHFIGQSQTAPFSIVWHNVASGTYKITAKVFDNKGLKARPNAADNDVDVSIVVSGSSLTLPTAVTIENCPTTNLNINQTYQLMAIVSPANANEKAVLWSTDNPAVLSVNDQGMVFVLSEGNANITATTVSGNLTASCQFTINPPVAVTDISIDNCPGENLYVSQELGLSSSILPHNAADKSTFWSSNNTNVVIVDESSGLLEAVGPGTATITVTSSNENVTSQCILNVDYYSVDSVIVDNPLNIESCAINVRLPLSAEVFPYNAADKSLVWSVGNAQMAEIDTATGFLTILPGVSGLLSVSAEAINGVTDVATINVNTLGIHRIPGVLHAGNYDNAGGYVASKPTIKDLTTVDSQGAYGVGDFTETGEWIEFSDVEITSTGLYEISIRASNNWYTGAAAEFVMVAGIDSLRFTIPRTGNWNTYQTLNFEEVFTSGIKSIRIQNTNNAGANISSIRFRLKNQQATYSLLVSCTNGTVVRTPQKAEYIEGEAVQLSIVADPGYVFSSWGGDLTGTQNPISIIMDSDKSVIANIEPMVYPVSGVILSGCPSGSIPIGTGFQLVAEIVPANATNNEIMWESENQEVATVDGVGVVSMVGEGSTTIFVTTIDGGFKDSCQVVSDDELTLEKIIRNEIRIFPNPSKNGRVEITIPNNQIDMVMVEIYTQAGVWLKTVRVTSQNGSFNLSVRELQAGTYLLKVNAGRNVYTGILKIES